jgi:hypothetical protein
MVVRSKASPGKQFTDPYLEKPFTKIRLVGWLQVKPILQKKKKKSMLIISVFIKILKNQTNKKKV